MVTGTLNVATQMVSTDLVVSVMGEFGYPFGTSVFDVSRQADHHQARRLVLDVHDVSFIDSDGLRALVLCRNYAYASGMAFALRGCSTNLRRVLQIHGLDAFCDEA